MVQVWQPRHLFKSITIAYWCADMGILGRCVSPPSRSRTGPALVVPGDASSNWGIARDAGHAVEVGIIARDLAQSAGLHDGDNGCIVCEQTDLLAYGSNCGDHSRGNRQYLKLTNA